MDGAYQKFQHWQNYCTKNKQKGHYILTSMRKVTNWSSRYRNQMYGNGVHWKTHTHTQLCPDFLDRLADWLVFITENRFLYWACWQKISVNLKMPLWWVPTATICSSIVYDTFVTLTFAGLFMLLVKEDKKVNKKVTIKLSYIQDVLCLLMVKKSL